MRRNNEYFTLILTLLLLTTNTQAQWYEKSNGLPEGWGSIALDAYDSLTAIGPIGFDSISVFITTDGANNWFPRPRPAIIHDIEMISKDKIWFNNWDGEIYATSDGGYNWQLQYYDPSSTGFMNYIEMFDSLNGFAMGDAPSSAEPALFLKTTNGGKDWISQNDSSLIGIWSGSVWKRIDFVDENLGYFFGSSAGFEKLYKTTNGGKNWRVLSDSIGCQVLKFYDENLGIIKAWECSNGQCTPGVHRTTDGGETWEVMMTESWEYGEDIEFFPGDPSKIWIITKHAGFFSSDTGRTWTEQFSNPDIIFWDIVFTDSEHGWLTGWGQGAVSYLFYTSNGGMGGLVSVEDDKVETIPTGYYLYQNYPNPFNPSTAISYQLPENSFVTLKVYDVLGNEMQTLVSEEKPAGKYNVEFRIDNLDLSSGVYFYQLKTSNFVETKKMILLK